MKIETVILYSTHLDGQWRFYHDILRLPCQWISENAFGVNTLHTQLEFHKSGQEQYYHFAFLIPTGKLDEAIACLESRGIELLLLDGEKIVHFNPGRAVYFRDMDGNIVEWIERPSVPEAAEKDFDVKNLICVNEIGIPVVQPLDTARKLMDEYGITPANPEGFSDEFCWVGDARGVMIVVKNGRHWLPTDIPSVANKLKIRYRSGKSTYHLAINGDEIEEIENGF